MAVDEIQLDVSGDRIEIPRELVSDLAAGAAARAGVSSQHRELSLALNQALARGEGSLSRRESRALHAVLEEKGLTLP